MSIVPLVLLIIVLTLIFSIFYLSIYNEFNENEYNNKLQILVNYMRRTNAEHPTPDYIGFVSSVDKHLYTVTYFDTTTLQTINKTTHDDRIETFNFLTQKFESVKNFTDESRIIADINDSNKFLVRGDDNEQYIQMQCEDNEYFDKQQLDCVDRSPCENKQAGNYALTANMLDKLVLLHRSADRLNNDLTLTHPTLYLRCLDGGSHVIEECPASYLFDSATKLCVQIEQCENKPNGYVLNYFPEHLTQTQFYMCQNNTTVLSTCDDGEVFDRRLMTCIKSGPCELNGAGHTFITADTPPNEFYLCVSNTQFERQVCLVRKLENNQYVCAGSASCSHFAQGTGTQHNFFEDDVWKFYTGSLTCQNFEVVNNVSCDTQNIVANKIFDNRFTINVHMPQEVYDVDTKSCVAFNLKHVEIKNKIFSINNLPNDYRVNFTTSMVGNTTNVKQIITNDTLSGSVTYARDTNSVGINPINGQTLECYGEHLYDIFNGRQLNICDTKHQLLERRALNESEYIKSIPDPIKIDSDIDYKSICSNRFDYDDVNFVEFDHFLTRIFTNILHSDVCIYIFGKIDESYTTIAHKYTTLTPQIYYDREKRPKYIEVYGANIQKNNSTIFRMYENILQKNRFSKNKIDFDHNKIDFKIDFNEIDFNEIDSNKIDINPMFEPFVKTADLQPKFTFFNNDETKNEGVENSPLSVEKKFVSYACFYALPTHKLTSCVIEHEHIKDKIKQMRSDAIVDERCANARNLSYVINSYVYIGDGVGCQCEFTNDATLHIKSVTTGLKFDNIATQSNDGNKYNPFVHVLDNTYFMACPPDLVTDDFQCDTKDDELYVMENKQQ
ncbi:VP91 [Urbanus proteus nucleopolyhedrovirus]|uniref:VP91 n=1 Tax=Urbanus proteus nucleopolyhedrovirus TaxID=1675866 RepID=A0A162GTZ4_9ABAC|nr:VP91 [Urbanus proteus nucleopolyhedrovirus]AKR17307.1 VP91 [Urbanus proteus nucleopolyhedrovirus]